MKGVGRKRKRIIVADDDLPKRWSDLPNELLESIKKRLCYIDQIKFSAVCKAWNCSGEGVKNSIPPLPQMPWLLIIYPSIRWWILIDPTYKKEYWVDTKSIQKKMNISSSNSNTIQCHESKNGWLLISSFDKKKPNPSTTRLFLYSPFLNEKNNCIELPILINFHICFATFTSNPLDDEDCKVITLCNSYVNNSILINTYRRGCNAWTSQVCNIDQFLVSDVKLWMYSTTDEDIFYYVIRDGRVGTFDLARKEWKVFPPLPTTMQATLRTRVENFYTAKSVYMVKSGEGELFLISECNLSSQKGSRWDYVGQFIYKLDISSMIWKDLNSVGERVLFIGDGYNSILSSSVSKTKGDRKGISNTIYWSSTWELKYCTVHDYTLRNSHNGYPRRQQCSRHYGHRAIISRDYRKFLIDPPLPRRPRW